MGDILGPAVPWDILREIAFICPRATCATLMRTCAFFYHEAAASILHHVIYLYDESVVTHFLRFLRAGRKPRYPCVRHLALCFDHHSLDPLSLDNAKALVAAIALMTEFVVVDIREDTIGDYPAIGHAIASLPSLRQVFIEEVGPRSCQFLISLQSAKLRSIKLDITDCESEEELSEQRLSPPWLPSHPVQFFGRWSSTLTELQYHSPFLPAAQYTPSCYPEVYPMMRTLSIYQPGCVDPVPYIRAFPNLAHLGINTESQLDDVHEYRTSNIRSQREVQRPGPASQLSGWQELVQFHGPLVDLYALALNCRISHIRLEDCMADTHLPLLSAVLADARPIHLNMGFMGQMDSLCSILQTQGASRLESLVIFFLISQCTPHEDVASALSSLATSLAMLPGPFRRLRMEIYLSAIVPDVHRLPLSDGLTIALAHVDVEHIVREFVEVIPTLEDVLVRHYRTDSFTSQEATFVCRGPVMRIGGTWVTDDPLNCNMFDLNARDTQS